MHRILKTFLLWLLIAALPIQGMAAVVKASCGPTHHQSVAAMMAEHHHAHDGHHHHADANIAADEHRSASSTASDKASDKAQAQKSAFCSACAACCFGAAAPPPVVFWSPTLVRSEAKPIPLAVLFTGYIPAGLERPPRHFSA
jgi:hypothetical protein